jgi:hypothetical protein
MSNNRGSILAITLAFMLSFTLLGFGTLYFVARQNEAAVERINSNRAFWLAEAGLEKAIGDFTANSCQGFVQLSAPDAACDMLATPCVSCSNCGSNYKCLSSDKTVSERRLLNADDASSYGDYEVVIDFLNSNVVATGFYPDRTVSNLFKRKVMLDTDSLFRNAVFAKGRVRIDNNLRVDSYDSRNGLYGGGNQFSFGGVASNGTIANVVDLGNNVVVNGNVSTGPGGTVAIAPGAQITGTITHTNTLTVPNVVVPSSLTSLASSGNWNISGVQTLNAGSYKYTAVNMNNNSTLNISGSVTVYLTSTSAAFSTGNNVTFNVPSGSSLRVYTDGTFRFGNNATINNVSQVAKNFRIDSTCGQNPAVCSPSLTDGVKLSNNATTSAAVYAPNTGVTITNNGDFYGAVIGNTITLSGSSNSFVHFDHALAEGGSLSSLKWSEL